MTASPGRVYIPWSRRGTSCERTVRVAAGRHCVPYALGENFRGELAHLLLHQHAAFNSPVWFNVGVKESRGYGWFYDAEEAAIKKMTSEARPQCSACFIVSVKDSLESILDLAKTEGMLFKWGSGTGTVALMQTGHWTIWVSSADSCSCARMNMAVVWCVDWGFPEAVMAAGPVWMARRRMAYGRALR